MPAQYIYSVSSGSNVDLSARVRAYATSMTMNAEEGSVGISPFLVDDPDAGINLTGLRQVWWKETSESSNQQIILKGWTTDRDIARGPFKTGSARQWTVNVSDQNAVISRRIMRGSDANRPAETDVQRIQWLMGTGEFGTYVTDSTYISTLFPVAMDAVDYRDQSNQQILDDCHQASGKNFHIITLEGPERFGLFYDFAGASPYRSAIRLTNVLGFVDSDITFAVSDPDTKLNRDPSRVYSGVVLPYVGGEVYVQSDAIGAAFQYRDTTAPSVNVKTSAKATARANRYLTDAETEDDVISTSFLVPLDRVNHVKEGMAVQCWFAHLPGYDQGWNWMRVLHRTVTATSEEYYTVAVDLTAEVGGLYAGGGKTSEGTTWPGSVIVAASPLQSCLAGNGLTYFYTSAGTRSALGLTFDPVGGHWQATSTDFMGYGGGGGYSQQYPAPGNVGIFSGSSVYGCGGSVGGSDYTCGGIVPLIDFSIVGPGSLTIITAPDGGPGTAAVSTAMKANLRASGTSPIIATDTQAPGTPLHIIIPDDGYCAHYVQLQGNGSWGFTSATWTPA